jgi:hypothetical protein
VSYHSTIIKNVCETLYVAESEDAEEDEYGSDTLDPQSEFTSTISDKSRKFKLSVWVKIMTQPDMFRFVIVCIYFYSFFDDMLKMNTWLVVHVHLFVRPSIHPSIHPSIQPFVHPSTYPSIQPSVMPIFHL